MRSPSDACGVVHPNLKGVFVGSGSDGMAEMEVTQAILDLCPLIEKPNVLYLGTATYDIPQFKQFQTQGLEQAGCSIQSLELVDKEVSESQIKGAVESADIVVVGGGNTLFAVDRWERLGLSKYLHQQAELGNMLLTGGSAGAICWFAAGHSDSMDPDSYKPAMQEKFAIKKDKTQFQKVVESTSLNGEEAKEWQYIRVPGLAMVPGILCPHHDRIQSNGVLRADDFDNMLVSQFRKHGSDQQQAEIGIGIDHWAALILEGKGKFRVLSLKNKPGSMVLAADGSATFCRAGNGIPGIWIKHVAKDGTVVTIACPSKGDLSDLLNGVVYELPDDGDEMRLINRSRASNPDSGPGLSSDGAS